MANQPLHMLLHWFGRTVERDSSASAVKRSKNTRNRQHKTCLKKPHELSTQTPRKSITLQDLMETIQQQPDEFHSCATHVVVEDHRDRWERRIRERLNAVQQHLSHPKRLSTSTRRFSNPERKHHEHHEHSKHPGYNARFEENPTRFKLFSRQHREQHSSLYPGSSSCSSYALPASDELSQCSTTVLVVDMEKHYHCRIDNICSAHDNDTSATTSISERDSLEDWSEGHDSVSLLCIEEKNFETRRREKIIDKDSSEEWKEIWMATLDGPSWLLAI